MELTKQPSLTFGKFTNNNTGKLLPCHIQVIHRSTQTQYEPKQGLLENFCKKQNRTQMHFDATHMDRKQWQRSDE